MTRRALHNVTSPRSPYPPNCPYGYVLAMALLLLIIMMSMIIITHATASYAITPVSRHTKLYIQNACYAYNAYKCTYNTHSAETSPTTSRRTCPVALPAVRQPRTLPPIWYVALHIVDQWLARRICAVCHYYWLSFLAGVFIIPP